MYGVVLGISAPQCPIHEQTLPTGLLPHVLMNVCIRHEFKLLSLSQSAVLDCGSLHVILTHTTLSYPLTLGHGDSRLQRGFSHSPQEKSC